MELRALKYFMTVAREESMTRAAEKLFITQPTLSRQIAELEDELGTPLFVRGNRNLALTAAGALLKRRVEEMLDLEEHRTRKRGQVRLYPSARKRKAGRADEGGQRACAKERA